MSNAYLPSTYYVPGTVPSVNKNRRKALPGVYGPSAGRWQHFTHKEVNLAALGTIWKSNIRAESADRKPVLAAADQIKPRGNFPGVLRASAGAWGVRGPVLQLHTAWCDRTPEAAANSVV